MDNKNKMNSIIKENNFIQQSMESTDVSLFSTVRKEETEAVRTSFPARRKGFVIEISSSSCFKMEMNTYLVKLEKYFIKL